MPIAKLSPVVTGTLGYDYIMDFPGKFVDRIMPDKIHQLSLSFLVDTLQKQFGGTAGNIAYTLKLLGCEPFLIAATGKDFSEYMKFLKKRSLQTSGIRVFKDANTSAYFVVTDMDDNQIGSFYLGATKHADTLSLIKAEFVVISSNTPTALASYVKQCVAKKMRYLYDPAFQIGELPIDELRDGITHAEIFIGNDYEIALTEKRLNISHTQLLGMVPIVITTLGSKGSRIESHGKIIEIGPAKAKAVVDPTGAGDAYRGGFIAGYLRKFDLQTCGQMGSIAAVYTVEKYGTITHSFTKPAFEKRYKDNYNQVLSLA